MAKKYIVDLTDEEREELLDRLNKGETSARKLKRVNILLLADVGQTDATIAETLHTSQATVQRIRQRFVEGNLAKALNDDPRSGRPIEFSGEEEAHLVALACSKPPPGRKCWTMQLLADKLIERRVVETISDETVRLRLKKTKPSPGNTNNGASRL